VRQNDHPRLLSPRLSKWLPKWLASWLVIWLAAMNRWIGRGGVVSPNRDLGNRGEQAAANLLKSKGYRILGRQVRVPMGEADLIAEDPRDHAIVVVEVKSRLTRNGRPGSSIAPERSVTAHKKKKLLQIARHLVRANRWGERPLRIDVVAVEFDGTRVCDVRHHVGAVVGRR